MLTWTAFLSGSVLTSRKWVYSLLSSVQFSHSVVSDSLWPHGRQHTRPPCPSPTPKVYLNSCPLSQGCYPTISSFVVSFSSCFQSFPESGSFQINQFFPSDGQSIGASASASVLPMKYSGLISFRIDWFGPWCQRTLKNLLQHCSSKASFFGAQLSLYSNSQIHTWYWKKDSID